MKITAVIPIRKGSQRVPNKNLRLFGDTTLLQNKIDVLLTVQELDEIIVNTDSEEAILIVKSYNNDKLKYHRRDNTLDGCSGGINFFKYLADTTDTDIFVYTPCTTPFISSENISLCINEFLNKNNNVDCITTGTLTKRFMWLDNKPINYDLLNAPASLDLPNIISLNFGVSVLYKSTLVKNNNVIGQTPKIINISEIEGLDIDTPLDFFIAEQIYKNKLY